LLTWVHRWSGLLIALVVVIVGVTGALTTYQDEIDRALNRDLFRVKRLPGPMRSLDEAVRAAEATGVDLRASSIRLPRSPRDAVEVSVAPRDAQVFSGWYVYVDPYRDHVLGRRPFDPEPWSRRGFVASVYEVHYSLAASRAGVWIVSLVACVWLLTTLLGVALAWPADRLEWRRALRVRFGGSAAQLHHDLHRVIGLLAAPCVVAILATGIALNFSPQATALVRRFSPLTFEPALPARSAPAPGHAIGWQAAVDAATDHDPDSQPYSIYRDAERNAYVVRMREDDAIHRRGQTRIYVDAGDGAVLAAWNPREGTAGDRLWGWLNPLHSGYGFGGVGRFIVCASGLAGVLLALTGVTLWYRRQRNR
jgi:uncharacterized iron-regulated membrane protein